MAGEESRQQHRVAVLELFRRLREGLYEEAGELMTEDFRFELPYTAPELPRPLSGRDRWVGEARRILNDFRVPYELDVLEFHELLDPNQLIADYVGDTVYLPTGRPYRNRYIGRFIFRGGKISFWREFHNPEVLTEAMRPPDAG